MTTKNFPIVIKFLPAVDCMLQLDEPSMYYSEFVIERKRTVVIVRATERAARSMLYDCRDRSDANGSYDQPLSWYSTARVAARRIVEALAAAQ
jgi:hypothetical protein